MVTLPPPPSWPPPKEPAPSRSRGGLLVGLIAVVALALCAGVVAGGFGIAERLDTGSPDAPADAMPPTPTPRRSPTAATPALEAATATVTGGPDTSFNLPVGTAAQFTDQDGTWTVALLGVEWFDQCEDFLGDAGGMVVLDIRYEVLDGAVSIIPITDFRFVPAQGSGGAGFYAGCADPPLHYTVISARAMSRGKIAFYVPSGAGGTLTYGQFITPTASWVVSGG